MRIPALILVMAAMTGCMSNDPAESDGPTFSTPPTTAPHAEEAQLHAVVAKANFSAAWDAARIRQGVEAMGFDVTAEDDDGISTAEKNGTQVSVRRAGTGWQLNIQYMGPEVQRSGTREEVQSHAAAMQERLEPDRADLLAKFEEASGFSSDAWRWEPVIAT